MMPGRVGWFGNPSTASKTPPSRQNAIGRSVNKINKIKNKGRTFYARSLGMCMSKRETARILSEGSGCGGGGDGSSGRIWWLMDIRFENYQLNLNKTQNFELTWHLKRPVETG